MKRVFAALVALLVAAMLSVPSFAGDAVEVRRPRKPAPKTEQKADRKGKSPKKQPASARASQPKASVKYVELSMRVAEKGPFGYAVGSFHSTQRVVTVMSGRMPRSGQEQAPALKHRGASVNARNQVALGVTSASEAKASASLSVAQIKVSEGPEQAAPPGETQPAAPLPPAEQTPPKLPVQATSPEHGVPPVQIRPPAKPPLPHEKAKPPLPPPLAPGKLGEPTAPAITPPKPGAAEAAPTEPVTAPEAETKASTEVKMGLPKGFARIVVPNGRITGNTSEKKYHVEGGVEIYWEDIVLKADQADIDDAAESAVLSGNVDATDPTYNMKSGKMTVRFKDKVMDAQDFVQFSKTKQGTEKPAEGATKRARITTILKNNKTKVYCSELTYNWDKGDFVATGEVKIVQDDLSADCDKLTYVKDQKQYTMEGDVLVTLSKYEWLFSNNIIEKPDEKVGRTLAKQESTLTADKVVFGEDSEVADATGSSDKKAVISQKDKRVEAPHIVIDDGSKAVKADGGVLMHQDTGDWLLESEQIKREAGDEDFIKEVKNPLDVTGDKLEYYYDKKNLKIDGNVKAKGVDKTATSDDLSYDDTTKLLVFDKNVVMTRGEKEHLYCDRVEINTDRRTFTFKGGVDGFFKYSTATPEQKPAAGAGSGAGGTTPKAPGGGTKPAAPGAGAGTQPPSGTQPGGPAPGR